VEKLYQELAEILEVDEVDPSRKFAEFETWDSLAALSLVASVRSNFGVVITSEDLSRAKTPADLEALIVSRTSANSKG
jgi:acyl carrier protein